MNTATTIMLLDDQADWIRMNKYALERAGFLCEGFTDRAQAVTAFRSAPHRYALVILDVNLGGQPDGVTLAKQLIGIKPDANLVLISTQAQLRGRESDLEEIAQASGLKYFRKKGDEQGGRQIVNIAKQYFVDLAETKTGSDDGPLSGGALQTWLEASEKPSENE